VALRSVNPATGQTVHEYAEAAEQEVSAVLSEAARAFADWKTTAFDARAAHLRRAGQVLLARQDELARLMALEMGKPLAQGRSEVEKCAWVCRYYADEGEGFLAPQEVKTEAARSRVVFEPLGAVLAVMPWNFPFWQVFRFAAPALMAGNAGLLKHAASVTGCALAIESLLREAGFPAPLFRALLIPNERVAAVIEAPEV